ncbi:hypothetical protein GF325_13525, partial [Candidatus Bathyarchaeota archaeon]|nr:hypothetical protein [Candidatus Bathyarchaeota archaeon]
MPTSDQENVRGINWESPFLRDFVTRLILLLTVPHVGFWVPAWIQRAMRDMIGWHIAGKPWLPSLLLSIAYLGFTAVLILWVIAKMGTFNRFPVETRSPQMQFEHIQIPVGKDRNLPGIIV